MKLDIENLKKTLQFHKHIGCTENDITVMCLCQCMYFLPQQIQKKIVQHHQTCRGSQSRRVSPSLSFHLARWRLVSVCLSPADVSGSPIPAAHPTFQFPQWPAVRDFQIILKFTYYTQNHLWRYVNSCHKCLFKISNILGCLHLHVWNLNLERFAAKYRSDIPTNSWANYDKNILPRITLYLSLIILRQVHSRQREWWPLT